MHQVSLFSMLMHVGSEFAWRPKCQLNYHVRLEEPASSRLSLWSLIKQRLCLIAIFNILTKPLEGAIVTGDLRSFQDQTSSLTVLKRNGPNF